jgi:hypothetical protein
LYKAPACLNTDFAVDLKNFDGGPAHGSYTDQIRAAPSKMLFPLVAARVK